MSAQILFTDLDGTLLCDDKTISPGNRQAIEEALAKGRRIVVTSGRPLVSSLNQAKLLGVAGPGCYVIAFNGAVIYDCSRQEEIFHQALTPEALYAVYGEARRQGAYIQTYDRTQVIIEDWCDPAAAQWYCGRLGMTYRVVGDIRRDLTETPVKALLINRENPGALDTMEAWIRTNLAERVDCFHSSAFFVEMVAPGVSKGVALEKLCRMLDIPIAQAVAAGDEANDISMIRAAGIGAAMCNGVQAAKDAANYITRQDNNHDGLAEIIRKFLL